MNLDYHLKTVEERKALVEKIIAEEDYLSSSQLKYMADYLLFSADAKQTGKEKKQTHPIITKNREVTISKRQVSFEGTAESLPGGEDSIYNMILSDNVDLLDYRSPITQDDIDNIPGVRENLAVIESLKKQMAAASGQRKYSLKRQIISEYQELYTLKASFAGHGPRSKIRSQINAIAMSAIPENKWVDEEGMPHSDGYINFFNPSHVYFLLKYYSDLKQDTYFDVNSDMRWMLIDLEELVARALLPDNEILYDLLVWEIDGLTGEEIVRKMEEVHGICHSEQYFSTIWCKKIPKLISEQAQREYLVYHYLYEDPANGHWKICRTCGKVKLAHPFFFHKNTSKDGYYSRCRECRAQKYREENENNK